MCSVLMRTDLLRARGALPLELPHTADVAAWAPLLLLGKSGFVNEACATFTYHNTSETARLGAEQLLLDGRKVAELIVRTAAVHVTDPKRRKTIQIEASRCFARRGLIALSDYRASGGAIQPLLGVMWRFRRDLSCSYAQRIPSFHGQGQLSSTSSYPPAGITAQRSQDGLLSGFAKGKLVAVGSSTEPCLS